MHQGDIFWADLNPVKGHEQAGIRPVMVIQNDILNQNLTTTVIVPLTTNLKAKGLMTTYFLPKSVSRLPYDSVALLYQVRTVDQNRLQTKVGSLKKEEFHELKRQFLFVF